MKKVLSVILAVIIMMQMFMAVSISAEENLVLIASSAEGYIGDTVSVKLSVDNAGSGFAGIEANVKFDKAVLKLVGFEYSEAILADFLSEIPNVTEANAAGSAKVAFLNIEKNVTADIEVATLTFEIISETPTVTVIDMNDFEASFAISNNNLVDIPMEISSSKVTVKEKPLGVTVSGTVTSFNSDTDDVTVALYKDANGAADYTATVKGNTASYSIDAVAAGTYTMKVSKKNHVTREYTVTVGETAVVQDAKIHLLGDVNGNGRIQINDVNALYKHFRNVELLDDYAAKCGDVVGTNGRVQINDVNALYKHFRGQDSLWD